MTKEYLYKNLDVDNTHNKGWQIAFDMYTRENPNHNLSGVGCKSCRIIIKKWLKDG